MLSRVALRPALLAASRPSASLLSVRHDSHYDPPLPASQNLTTEEISARFNADIAKRENERFGWYNKGFKWTATYVIYDHGFEYFAGGIPGWAWIAFGGTLASIGAYYMKKGRYFDVYVDQHNPEPDLLAYKLMQERLAKEPDFWNWDERDKAATAAAESSSD